MSKAEPDITRELRQMLKAWRKEVDAKLPRPNPAYKKKRPGVSAGRARIIHEP